MQGERGAIMRNLCMLKTVPWYSVFGSLLLQKLKMNIPTLNTSNVLLERFQLHYTVGILLWTVRVA